MTYKPFCILPVSSINSVVVGEVNKSSITSKLLSQWSNNVGLDIVEQIKNST